MPTPPIALQRKYVDRITAIDKLKAIHRAALIELDALFASLQHHAFRGEILSSASQMRTGLLQTLGTFP